jgi:hypothetical protein
MKFEKAKPEKSAPRFLEVTLDPIASNFTSIKPVFRRERKIWFETKYRSAV